MTLEWKDLILAGIASLPAIVAAVSSVRNGRAIKNGKHLNVPFLREGGSRWTESGSGDHKSGHKQ
jgi:hypothetical protein